MSHPEPLVIAVFGLAGLLVALQLWLHWPRRPRRPPRTGFDAMFRAAGRGAARQRQVESRTVPPLWQEEPPEPAPPAKSPREGPQ